MFIYEHDLPTACHVETQIFEWYATNTIPKHCCNSIKYRFEFTNGNVRYSCGIPKHICDTVGAQNENNSISQILKRVASKSNTPLIQFIAIDKSKLLDQPIGRKTPFGPLTEKQYYRSRVAFLKDVWIKQNASFQSRFHGTSIKQLEAQKREIERRMCNVNETANFARRREELATIYTECRTFVQMQNMTHIKYMMYVEAWNHLKSLKMYRLPWVAPYEQKRECTICLEKIDGPQVGGELHCEHSFHHRCITSWIKKNKSSCPNCRACFNPSRFLVS